jgi:hypothetical protein
MSNLLRTGSLELDPVNRVAKRGFGLRSVATVASISSRAKSICSNT